jgi:RNA polymerase sigma-70 factor (ECF subfamily)
MAISKDAFETEVMALLGRLHGVARRLTRNDADAEDLVSEAISKAWRCRESLADHGAFGGWMFRILNNTFISDQRRRRVRPRFESFDETGDDDAPPFSMFDQLHQPFLLWFSTPEQAFLDQLLREDLDRALAALPAHHRIVVILSDLEGLKYAEIAEALDVPIGTVRSRLARARSALQKVLWQQARDRGLRAADAPGPAPSERGVS